MSLPFRKLWGAVLYRWLYQKATKRNILLALLICVLINSSFILISSWVGYAEATLPNGDPTMPLDLLAGYTPDEAYMHLTAYGDSGRKGYLFISAVVDMIYPIAYSLLFSMLMIVLLANSYPEFVNSLYKLTFIPFLIAICDYFENICFVILTLSYPDRLDGLVRVASPVTQTKWLITTFVMGSVIVGVITWLANRKRLAELKQKKH